MIRPFQRVLFWSLNAGIILVSLVIIRGCMDAHRRLAAPADETPIAAPTSASEEPASLYVASDSNASIALETRNISLPEEPSTRARVLLTHLLAEYAQPNSPHPLPAGPSVDDVFLVNLPVGSSNSRISSPAPSSILPYPPMAAGQLAIVNLHGSFADNHPSGVETENLTLMSIIGSLHAALPDLTQVRFLVDGQPRETLAGHADLTRTYPATDTSTAALQPSPDQP